jgi:rubrerythrin
MMSLASSKTLQNLKDAFAGESQANRRYLYFAQKADVEGYNDVAAVFRSTAEGETGHAHGHLEFMETVGDPATGLPIGGTGLNLKAAIAGETHEYTDMYPGMARTARDEGFEEIADWFETLAKAEKSHAGRFQRALDGLDCSAGSSATAADPTVRRRPCDDQLEKKTPWPTVRASRRARAASTRPSAVRSNGATTPITTWKPSRRRWSASSTSVTDAGAASICATASRSCST